MDERLTALVDKIKALEAELEVESARHFAEMQLALQEHTEEFRQELKARQRALKRSTLRYIVGAHPLMIITAPVIYALIIAFVILDLGVTIYQAICFPVYGIAKVRRSDYLVFDRSRLPYLNLIEKVNCAYCSYGNGVIAYAREIAARTEQYWCPIKHARRVLGAHARYQDFVDYGDGEAFRRDLATLQKRLAEVPGP
ncbi:hypothetical protein E8L99_00950 [Phreatobacter aquaticus]|uniref:Uncharacterized protein n=2 Tax=Phreatobacter aquaticus TaxID=2570229 RepID=A0A4D7QLU0_9HYPH|nr:hypothetical protein E8L99_00950 [Phreatobacter aquaticus]